MTAAQIDQGHGGRDSGTERGEPDRRAWAEQDAVGLVELAGRSGSTATARGVGVVGHQQLVCESLLVLRRDHLPSLVVIEQFSLLNRNRLDACTEPNSDFEIGVTVSDHGM